MVRRSQSAAPALHGHMPFPSQRVELHQELEGEHGENNLPLLAPPLLPPPPHRPRALPPIPQGEEDRVRRRFAQRELRRRAALHAPLRRQRGAQVEAEGGVEGRLLPQLRRHRRVPPRHPPRQLHPVEQIATPVNDGLKGIYRVDVDVPADDWANVTKFYDVLVFNTGHWWGLDKFPKETPLVFYREGKPITPLGISGGLRVVLQSMISHIEREVPKETIKFWRTQSPRHFYGGEWDHNGSCLFTEPLKQEELDSWFDPRNGGVNKEAREVNQLIQQALKGTSIQLLNLTHLSEFRADAHPAIWLGKKDAVAVWGQDCMHWCLPGLPDTWVDILSARILDRLEVG